MGRVKEILRLMFTKQGSGNPTVEQLAEVAAQLPEMDSLGALYLGAETFGVEDPKGKVLGIIDGALALVKAGMEKLRQDIATARQDMAAVVGRYERELAKITQARDRQLAELRSLAVAHSARLDELEEELEGLAGLREVFAGEEE